MIMKAHRASPSDQQAMVSASELARMLRVSHEYARRLIVESGQGRKNQSGYWLISRTWAEKYARLREAYRPLGTAEPPYYRLTFTAAQGGVEHGTISEDRLSALESAFGPMPMTLGPEDASVLRTREAFNNKHDGRDTLRYVWIDEWAARIERSGILKVRGIVDSTP